jgi:hypothetical protein
MGIEAGEGRWGSHPEWSVVVNGVWLGEGDRWKITPDGTVTINGATGNVSISHYSFLSLNEADKNLSFYEQHSVSIITIVFVSFISGLGTILWLRTARLDRQRRVTLNQEYVTKKVSSD